jgi:hypothetical protein
MNSKKYIFLLVLASNFAFVFSSCLYYQRYAMPKARLEKIGTEPFSYYIVDAAHPLTKAWYVAEAKIQKDEISGFISRLSETEALDVGIIRNRLDAKNSRNDVLVFVSPRLAMGLSDNVQASIPIAQIERVEVHEPNFGRSIGSMVLGGGGALFLIGMLSLDNDF